MPPSEPFDSRSHVADEVKGDNTPAMSGLHAFVRATRCAALLCRMTAKASKPDQHVACISRIKEANNYYYCCGQGSLFVSSASTTYRRDHSVHHLDFSLVPRSTSRRPDTSGRQRPAPRRRPIGLALEVRGSHPCPADESTAQTAQYGVSRALLETGFTTILAGRSATQPLHLLTDRHSPPP